MEKHLINDSLPTTNTDSQNLAISYFIHKVIHNLWIKFNCLSPSLKKLADFLPEYQTFCPVQVKRIALLALLRIRKTLFLILWYGI